MEDGTDYDCSVKTERELDLAQFEPEHLWEGWVTFLGFTALSRSEVSPLHRRYKAIRSHQTMEEFMVGMKASLLGIVTGGGRLPIPVS